MVRNGTGLNITKRHFPYIAQGFDISDIQIQIFSLKNQNLEPIDSSAIIVNTLNQIKHNKEGLIEIAEDKIDKEAHLFLVLGYTIQ